MAFTIRTLLLVTFGVAIVLILLPRFAAVLAFLLLCTPFIFVLIGFRRIRERLGRLCVVVTATFALALAYVAFAGP